MENPNTTFIEYPNWSEWVKTITAFYWKSFILKNPKVIFGISAVNLIGGGILLAQYYFLFDTKAGEFIGKKGEFAFVFLAAINIVLGLFNLLFTYRMYTWVYANSSWEERFAHKSSGKHQFQYFLMWVVLLGISLGITYIFVFN